MTQDPYQTIQINRTPYTWTITIHRPKNRNSINDLLLEEIQTVLDEAELNSNCRIIVFQGENGIFCTGMDFKEFTQQQPTFSALYMAMLKHFTTTSKIIISVLDGQVLAGGVGIVAASDLVLSTRQTQFGLSEVLWGLLPACVIPFLIRRVGFQKAYTMALTTETLDAEKALSIGLIDELTNNPAESLRMLRLRLCRVDGETVQNLKAYFRKMWIINETMEKNAVAEISRLMNEAKVQTNIKNFMEHQRFPWENGDRCVT